MPRTHETGSRLNKLNNRFKGAGIRVTHMNERPWWIEVQCVADGHPIAEWRVHKWYLVGEGRTLDGALDAAEQTAKDKELA